MEDLSHKTTSRVEGGKVAKKGRSGKGFKGDRTLKEMVKDALFSDDSPKKVALGTGIGVLMAFSPLAGTQTVSALFLAFLFGANRISTLAGTFVANPITMPIFYFMEIVIGKEILGFSLALPKGGWSDINGLLSLGGDFLMSSFLGFAILGPLASVIFYLLTYRTATLLRERRMGG